MIFLPVYMPLAQNVYNIRIHILASINPSQVCVYITKALTVVIILCLYVLSYSSPSSVINVLTSAVGQHFWIALKKTVNVASSSLFEMSQATGHPIHNHNHSLYSFT